MTLDELIHTNETVLVDFFAEWCGPCHTLKPILQQVKQHVGDAVKIVKVDVDKYRDIVAEYQIRSMPTLILFRNGEIVWRYSGVLSARDIVNVLNQNK